MTLRAGARNGEMGYSVPSPIQPVINTYWLYVPRAHIVIPYSQGGGVTNYYLNENGVDRFLTEDGANLLILES